MMIEVSAKKVDEAIKQGLAQLGVTLEDVTVEVLDAGGLFRKAKVRLTVDGDEPETKPENTADVDDFRKTPVKPEKPEKSDKPEKAEKADKAEKEDKPAKPEKADKADKPVKPENADKADKPVKPEKVKKAAKPEKSENAQKSGAEKPVVAKKAEAKHERRPDKPVKSGEIKEAWVLSEEDKKAAQAAAAFVRTTIEKMGLEATAECDSANAEHIIIDAVAGDDSLIIGRHGETLDALQLLAETYARADKHRLRLSLDCNGYRERRAQSLAGMARRRAEECVRKNRRIRLECMDRVDRRTVHSALNDDKRVYTTSEGREPSRFVVIYPAKQATKNPSAEYSDNDSAANTTVEETQAAEVNTSVADVTATE